MVYWEWYRFVGPLAGRNDGADILKDGRFAPEIYR